jgi:hypothetical protein
VDTPYVISGGYWYRDFNSAQTDIVVKHSGPDPGNPAHGWNCRMDNQSSASRAVLWWAICSSATTVTGP